MPPVVVGYFVESLAKNSINRKLALALTRLAPSEVTMRGIRNYMREFYAFIERVYTVVSRPG